MHPVQFVRFAISMIFAVMLARLLIYGVEYLVSSELPSIARIILACTVGLTVGWLSDYWITTGKFTDKDEE